MFVQYNIRIGHKSIMQWVFSRVVFHDVHWIQDWTKASRMQYVVVSQDDCRKIHPCQRPGKVLFLPCVGWCNCRHLWPSPSRNGMHSRIFYNVDYSTIIICKEMLCHPSTVLHSWKDLRCYRQRLPRIRWKRHISAFSRVHFHDCILIILRRKIQNWNYNEIIYSNRGSPIRAGVWRSW